MRVPRHHGHTLAELLAICAVLAVGAAVALPSGQPVADFRADAAINEAVQALRFARSEAQRTGAYRALGCDLARNRLTVYIPDANGASTGAATHPLTKMDYIIDIAQAPAGGNARLSRCSFVFTDNTTNAFVAFDANGTPVAGAKQAPALRSGTIVLAAGGATRTVAVDANGRVTTS
jgi:Tfp pilus assembly protein FimT